MCLVDDYRETLALERLHIFDDHRELLQRGDDDRDAVLKRLLELFRGFVDILKNTLCGLELLDCLLQLAIKDAPIGDDDDGVEDTFIVFVVEERELIGKPGEGIALAAARAVFDEVVLSRPS